ncbi:serine/arginine repetitive matrix protein 1-like isoform X2 [Eriocheir sinensis]|uniref:serine/arginine repetitive matrix protein 1-like isoform X2 n=1 Tax=Eriocheir sinensis TaxID=95602 RepID=UPI0021C67AB1|nr:serine/arginine repetitive matrix protein 1-like isoform X2 [Eriocheir sinensis]
MSVRRDNRSAGGLVTPGGPHAKLTNDRHNHELLKRLATHAPRKQPPPAHATPGKGPPAEGVASPGGRAGPREVGRGRGEAGPSKSLLRPTSSSAMKAAGGATPAARRLDSNKRPRPPAARKAGAGDAPARRSHGRAPPADKEEKDSSEDKLRQDSLPETPDKDRRDAPTPPPPGPETPAPVTNEAPAKTPTLPSPAPASPPAPAPSTPTQGPQRRHQDAAQSGGKACVRPAAGRGGGVGLETAPPPSREEVLRGVRARVGGEVRRGGVDADKDVCEAAGEEDEEFYRVRVRTRLVTYDNNTLVIRNTSRGGASPPEAPQESPPEARPEAPLQEPLPEADAHQHPPAEPQQDPQTDPDPHVQPTPTPPAPAPAPDSQPVFPSAVADSPTGKEEAPHSHAHAVIPAAPPSQAGTAAGVKRRLTLLVNRGRSFLAEVYSATQSRLENYVRQEAPRPAPRRAHALSQPLLVEVNPLWVAQHLPQAQWVPVEGRDLTGVPFAAPYTAIPEGAAGRRRRKKKKKEADEAGVAEEEAGGNVGVDEGVGAGVGVQVDEEWIKKNILCTCKCRQATEAGDGEEKVEEKDTRPRKVQKHGEEREESGVEEEENNEEVEKEKEEEEEERKKTEHDIKVDDEKSEAKEEEEDRDVERVTEEKEEEKEEEEEALCYCSCHEGEGGASLPYLPTQVQELLDADHARMWWTITGNFGNILPIDWSKTYTRQQYLPVLNLNEMKEGSSSEDEGVEESTSSGENMQDPPPRPCPPHLYHDKLKNMSVPELNEALMELELVIRQYSETLITQLALRDELEYEKELKNSFISLLLQVQNKRRNFNVEKKKQKKVGPNGIDPKYLTTVIPYDVGHGPPHNPTLQILIKILTAINEDSPTVPTLLTDYILKVLCPS